jgi:hypothetical protein
MLRLRTGERHLADGGGEPLLYFDKGLETGKSPAAQLTPADVQNANPSGFD